MSSVNDHGPNDFDSQISTNEHTMAQIAISFSENYLRGIEWYVQDSWGGLPELRIRTQGDPDYTYLSGGDSFNYGHNIPLQLKNE